MIQGIGTDIIEVQRIAIKIGSNPDFKLHVFSEEEIAYCEKQKNPAMHFAARWAVKEAYLKAYGLKFIGNHRLREIGVLHSEDGKPFVSLAGKALDMHIEKGLGHIHVSMSHTERYAMASIVIEN